MPSDEEIIMYFPDGRVVFGGTDRALEVEDGEQASEEEVVMSGVRVEPLAFGEGAVLGAEITDRETCVKHG